MIKQCAVTDIESRSECNPYDSTGFLPLIVAPMYSCIDKHNAHIFLDNKIKVCMPRKEYMDETYINCSNENYFDSYSLQEFIEFFIDSEQGFLNDSNFNKVKTSVCIDTAAGHLKKLHDAIRKAKEIHGDNLIIMAGNVTSVEAFVELAKTGADYIRVGIGGGGGCNTTSNTGVGQENLEVLIKECLEQKKLYKQYCIDTYLPHKEFSKKHGFVSTDLKQKWANISSVKIVADGISTYIKQCEKEYNFNDNGYAAINKLLFAGADLVMIGKLFAQCIESAGEKAIGSIAQPGNLSKVDSDALLRQKQQYGEFERCFVKYSGMSTQEEQKKYKDLELVVEKDLKLDIHRTVNKQLIKPSEGSVSWIPVRWSLFEWLDGSTNQDEPPYLMGWVNSIRSAMSYTGKKSLK